MSRGTSLFEKPSSKSDSKRQVKYKIDRLHWPKQQLDSTINLGICESGPVSRGLRVTPPKSCMLHRLMARKGTADHSTSSMIRQTRLIGNEAEYSKRQAVTINEVRQSVEDGHHVLGGEQMNAIVYILYPAKLEGASTNPSLVGISIHQPCTSMSLVQLVCLGRSKHAVRPVGLSLSAWSAK